MAAIDTSGFQPRTLDKVERLLDLLDEMQRHPDLKGKLAMHGGTAINLFMLDIPRLSVDIDISYVGALPREEMLRERPFIECAIEEVGRGQGYDVSAGDGGHAGRTFVLRYRGDWGTDHVKIDCIYMNRSPLFPIRSRCCPLRPDVGVPMFEDAELAGGKVKAFFDRVKIRDLYDNRTSRRTSTPRAIPTASFTRCSSTTLPFPHTFRTSSKAGASGSKIGRRTSKTSCCRCCIRGIKSRR